MENTTQNVPSCATSTTHGFPDFIGRTTFDYKLPSGATVPATSQPFGMIHANSDAGELANVWEDAYDRLLVCADCGLPIKRPANSCSTGYGTMPEAQEVVCYDCCGKRDLAELQNAKPGDKFTFYLIKEKNGDGHIPTGCWVATNWPGTWKHVVFPRVGNHNWAGVRRDVWFSVGKPDGSRNYFHGIQYGDDSEICHVTCLKHSPWPNR